MTNPDITIERGENVAEVEGVTDEGIDFVDAYTGPMLQVLDSGRITVPAEAATDFEAAATKAKLTLTNA